MSDGHDRGRVSVAERLRRLPIRVRLTLIFAAAMLFVLTACGVVVFERVRSQVDARINLDVSRQASALLSRVVGSQSGLTVGVTHPLGRGRQVAQILDSHGRVLASSPGLKGVPLLKGRQLKAALRHRVKSDRPKRDPLPSSVRLISTPISVPGHGSGVLIVGTSLDERAASLSSLALALVIVGPIALLIATAAGYRLTRATLEPVELMSRRAAEVSPGEPWVRLPLPPADDEIRELGSTLNEMLGRLEESLAREQAFVANASHELRTPLSNLRIELDLALRRPRSPEELVEALRSVQGEVDRLSDLADDLLVMARADDGLPIRTHAAPARAERTTACGRPRRCQLREQSWPGWRRLPSFVSAQRVGEQRLCRAAGRMSVPTRPIASLTCHRRAAGSTRALAPQRQRRGGRPGGSGWGGSVRPVR